MWFTGSPNVDRMWDKRNISGLIKALNYPKDPKVREKAAYILGEIRGRGAVEPLIAALKDTEVEVCEKAATALGKMGDTHAIDPLLETLKHKNYRVREATAKALDKLGWKPEHDEAAGAYWSAKKEWYKCEILGSPAVEPLIRLLNDEYHDIQIAAARSLGDIGDPRAVEPLIVSLHDSYDDVRSEAARALGKLGDRRAVEPLITILKGKAFHSVRSAAASTLGTLIKVHPSFAPVIDKALAGWNAQLKEWDKQQAIIDSTRSANDLWSECLNDPS